MKLQFILGATTFLTGLTIVIVGTDFGRIINVTIGVIVGAVLMLIGMARLKHAWINRNHDDE